MITLQLFFFARVAISVLKSSDASSSISTYAAPALIEFLRISFLLVSEYLHGLQVAMSFIF